MKNLAFYSCVVAMGAMLICAGSGCQFVNEGNPAASSMCKVSGLITCISLAIFGIASAAPRVMSRAFRMSLSLVCVADGEPTEESARRMPGRSIVS